MRKPALVMIVDDHPIVREGLEMLINLDPNLEVVASEPDGIAAQKRLEILTEFPDVIVVDLQLPKLSGVDFIKQLKQNAKLVVLSTEINTDIVSHMMDYGVHGYLLKSEEPNKIVNEIAKIVEDDSYISISNDVTLKMMSLNNSSSLIKLSDKQIKLLKLVAKGLTNKQIGNKMFVTDRTIKLYLTEIYEVLHVSNRAQAIAVAVKEGLIEP